MPLKIELKPNERLIIGNATIRNGDRRASFVLETNTRFLRESEIITEREADTPCKRLYLFLQVMYLVDDPLEAETEFMASAVDIMKLNPGFAPGIAAIYDANAEGERYKALKLGRELIAYEASLHAGHEGPAAPAA